MTDAPSKDCDPFLRRSEVVDLVAEMIEQFRKEELRKRRQDWMDTIGKINHNKANT